MDFIAELSYFRPGLQDIPDGQQRAQKANHAHDQSHDPLGDAVTRQKKEDAIWRHQKPWAHCQDEHIGMAGAVALQGRPLQSLPVSGISALRMLELRSLRASEE